MSDFTKATQQNSSTLIATAEQAYDWSGVLPAACLPGLTPLAGGTLSQTKSQMVRDFMRYTNCMVGLRSGTNGVAILNRSVPVDDDRPSELASRFFDPDRFLVTRTKTINLAEERMSLIETVVVRSPFGFPVGMRTNDPTIVLVPDSSWALFSTEEATVISYGCSGLIVSIEHLNGGTFTNREIMKPSSDDWAALLGRNAK